MVNGTTASFGTLFTATQMVASSLKLLLLMLFATSVFNNDNTMMFPLHAMTAMAAPFDPFEYPSLPFSRSSRNNDNVLINTRRSVPMNAIVTEEGENDEEELPPPPQSSSVLNPPPPNGVRFYTLQRRSFPGVAIANRRSAHPCRWKLCGAYQNYSLLRRFF